jgi:hypothetical protein
MGRPWSSTATGAEAWTSTPSGRTERISVASRRVRRTIGIRPGGRDRATTTLPARRSTDRFNDQAISTPSEDRAGRSDGGAAPGPAPATESRRHPSSACSWSASSSSVSSPCVPPWGARATEAGGYIAAQRAGRLGTGRSRRPPGCRCDPVALRRQLRPGARGEDRGHRRRCHGRRLGRGQILAPANGGSPHNSAFHRGLGSRAPDEGDHSAYGALVRTRCLALHSGEACVRRSHSGSVGSLMKTIRLSMLGRAGGASGSW